jgi:hypothetical protein
MTDRTAIDTIKGYFYQFDHAIAKLLDLEQGTDTITVEGIEDIDVNADKEETAIQCKYYAKTEYNHSVIAKPIRLMLNHYKEVIGGNQKKINYKIYGHFHSGQNKLTLPIDATFLKDSFLTYTENRVKYFHHNDLNLTEKDLADFLSLLTVDISALEYQAQLSKIFTLLTSQLGCNTFEAEHFYYNNALKVIKDIAVEGKLANRKISKETFIAKINFKRVLFNEWFIKYKGENKLFADLRRQYFTALNISPFERFFIIEVPVVNYLRSELKDLLFTISRKWAKLSSREPAPFCPYIYLHNLSKAELIEVKKELVSEGFMFSDGFDFEGADFNPKAVSKQVGPANQIKLKILNTMPYIDITIKEITKTKEIYQFYFKDVFFKNIYINIKQINIQFTKLSDVQKII